MQIQTRVSYSRHFNGATLRPKNRPGVCKLDSAPTVKLHIDLYQKDDVD